MLLVVVVGELQRSWLESLWGVCTPGQGREGLKGLGIPVSNHLSACFALSLISEDRASQGEAQKAFVSKLFPDSKLSAFSLPSKGSQLSQEVGVGLGWEGWGRAWNPSAVNGVECKLLNTALGGGKAVGPRQ